MGQNFLVQNLAVGKIGGFLDIYIEDNIGEGIHVHFRINNSFDVRLNFSISEFLEFAKLIENGVGILSGDSGNSCLE